MKCVLTLSEFDPTQQQDGEHIIPASLGGNLKSRHVICPAANTGTSKLDAALYEIFKITNGMFQITSERDRKNVKTVTLEDASGDKFTWHPDSFNMTIGHPQISWEKTETGGEVKVSLPYHPDETLKELFCAKLMCSKKKSCFYHCSQCVI